MRRLMFAIVFFAVALCAWGEAKHPKVAELEDKFKGDAVRYLEGRFPGLPISVTVSVEPLRRQFSSGYDLKGEQLPYYALEKEEIRDEWDDPTVSLYSLYNRVKKVQLMVHVPGSVGDEELVEIQNTLTQILRLVPARDDIQVVRRKWSMGPNIKIYGIAASSILIALLIGLFVISKTTVTRMASSLEKIQLHLANTGQNSGPAPIASMEKERPQSSSSMGGDVRFNDPIKVREVIHHQIDDVIEAGEFIRLENILKLDELAKDDPSALGALLVLFPMNMQQELFALSSNENWMEAFNDPGSVSLKCLDVLEDLCRVKAANYRKDWELLLIQVWRLGDDASAFLRAIDLEKAMAILINLPKNMSVPLAREAFPGNWAAVLDPSFKYKELSDLQCQALFNKALELKPLVEFEILEIYRKERELIEYLHYADIRSEKEVYETAPDGGLLKELRPPFYVIFEGDLMALEVLAKQVPIEKWAQALFNVPREERVKLEQFFTQKEKFIYLELLKSFDQDRNDKESMAQARAQVARLYRQLINSIDAMSKMTDDVGLKDDNEAA